MGLRFRKSVKICKGVKVNFSKSGASLSLGGRGHSLNFGGRGSRATVGIPGTGLSYSTNLSSHNKAKASHRSSSSRTGVAIPESVQLVMGSDGKVEIQDARGQRITDQSVIRKIKQTDTYKNQVDSLEQQRQEMLDSAYIKAKEENNRFIEIYKLSPQVDGLGRYQQVLSDLKPPVYKRKVYEIPYPTNGIVIAELKEESKNKVHGNLFSVGKLRKQYVKEHLQDRINMRVAQWTNDKALFEQSEDENEQAENLRFTQEFEVNKQYMNDLISGNDDIINSAVESWIESCELPVEINVNYEWHHDSNIMYLDVDLPEIEDLPEDEMVRLASGNLKEKKKTQNTLKQEYVTLVFGLAIFISANVFNVSPAINGIVVSGYTQRRDKNGIINDDYVYSIKFTRDIFENSVLENVNPVNFCMRFENRCNMTNTMLLRKVEPFEIE